MSISEITAISQEEQELLTKYKTVITSDHAYIHKGLGFKAIIKKASQTADFFIAFTTPASAKDIHWRPALVTTSTENVGFTVYEGDTFTGGTDVTPVCLNRKMDSTSAMQALKDGVTSTPTGTIIQSFQTGGGSGGNSIGGGTSSSEERLLKQDTTYIVKVEPAGSTDITMELFWYEEDEY